MKIAIFTLGSPGAYILADAAQALGHDVLLGDFVDEEARQELATADALIPRISHASYERAIAVTQEYLKRNPSGISTVSPAGIERSFDKWHAYQGMIAAGVPTPDTFLVQNDHDLDGHVDQLPLIVKPRSENQGKGIAVVRTVPELRTHVQTLLARYGSCIVQRFVEESAGTDIRAFVIGDQVVAAMERRAASGELANLALGGTAHPVTLSSEESTIAVRAAQLFNASYAGVDVLRSSKGPVVLEVNASPGLKIATITKVDIPSRVIEYLVSRKEKVHD